VDNDRAKIERLQKGQIPFFEPGLEDLIRRNICEKRPLLHLDIDQAVKKIVGDFYRRGTPPKKTVGGSPFRGEVWREIGEASTDTR